MKRLFLLGIAFAFLNINETTGQVKFPSPSPTQTIKQEFGLGNIEVIYSRPGAKGRRVFGDLVPYGKLWRTGANEATKIAFSEQVEIIGRKIEYNNEKTALSLIAEKQYINSKSQFQIRYYHR